MTLALAVILLLLIIASVLTRFTRFVFRMLNAR